MENNTNKSEKSEIEQIKEFIFLILKNWYYFAISFFIFGVIGIIHLKTATPVVNVMARVALRQDESLMKGNSLSKSQSLATAFGLGGGTDNVEDESLKIGSQGYVKRVVRKLELNKQYIQTECLGFVKTNLYDQSPIVLSVDPAIADTIAVGFSFALKVKSDKTTVKVKAGKVTIGSYEITSYPKTINTLWGDFTLEKSKYYDLYEKPIDLKIYYSDYDYITQIYREALSVEFEKRNSKLINMEMPSENAPLTKRFLDEVINAYNEEWDENKGLVSQKTLSFIDERLLLTKQLLVKADIEIKQFKNKYNLTDIEADVTYYLTLTGELQPEIIKSETQLKMADIIVDFVQDEKNKYVLIPYSLSTADESMALIIGKYNEELTKRNEMYKSNTQSALSKTLDDQFELQRKNLLLSLNNIKKGMQIATDNVKKKEQEMAKKIGNIPLIEQDYLSLKREQELQQTIYIFLLEMREQAAVTGINLLPKLHVIDPPYVLIKPLSPSTMKTAIMVLFFGAAFPLAIIYVYPYLRTFLRKRKNK